MYPFSAIIGQEEMKFAAIMNIIDPNIGGIMVMGDRGTGKSTTVRALVDLLPLIDIVKDDAFMSSPTDPNLMAPEVLARYKRGETMETARVPINMVDLPLGATEDRVCGTIDIEKALTEGTKAFEPGLLAKANRGILYVDEVNLLDDHLVDVLLDSAASGWNTVEREGISICHPARFILIGSGNPEEGELRPQLLDRFGMHAQITTVKKPEERVRVVEERTAFDADPKVFRLTCPWVPPKIACAAPSTSKRPSPKAPKRSNPGFSPKPTAVFCTWTKSTSWTTTSWMCFWTPPPQGGTPWNAKASPSATPRGSS